MPNDYGQAMQMFLKIRFLFSSSPKTSFIISVGFVDDSNLPGNTYGSHLENNMNTLELLKILGFTIHLLNYLE